MLALNAESDGVLGPMVSRYGEANKSDGEVEAKEAEEEKEANRGANNMERIDQAKRNAAQESQILVLRRRTLRTRLVILIGALCNYSRKTRPRASPSSFGRGSPRKRAHRE